MNSLKIYSKRLLFRALSLMVVIIGLFTFCISCDLGTAQDETISYYEDIDQSITKYVESNSERFSILYSILETTGLNHLFKTYGDYTFLAPTDSAFNSYFEKKGVNSYTDFTKEELTELIKYHVFNSPIVSGGFNMGIIYSKTLSDDYMVSGPSENGTDIMLNKYSRIILKDVILPNGILHEIDEVLENPQNTIYTWLQENKAEYSIFLEAVEKTGLDEMANKTDPDTSYFYSCFITPDSKFSENNINSFADLAQLASPDDDNFTDPENALHSYIASHFTIKVISTSEATEDPLFIGTLGGATIKYSLIPNTAEVVLNYLTSDFPSGLSIDEFHSNNLVGNGVIHLMDTVYMVTSSFTRFNLCYIWLDVPGFPYDSVYQVGVDLYRRGLYSSRLHRYWPRDGIKHIPWERCGDWLTLNAPYSGFIRLDHHRVSDWRVPQPGLYGRGQPAFFNYEICDDLLDVTRKLPYIIPGKYRLYHYVKVGPHRPSVIHYFDGEAIGGVVNMARGVDYQSLYLGTVDIKEGTTEHFLRVKMVTKGYGFFVAIKFEPVY